MRLCAQEGERHEVYAPRRGNGMRHEVMPPGGKRLEVTRPGGEAAGCYAPRRGSGEGAHGQWYETVGVVGSWKSKRDR